MSDAFELNVELREDMGKGASRRLRRISDQIPAILYGGDKPPQPLSVIRKDFEKALENEAFYSHVLTLQVAGKTQKAILKDLQRHPAKDRVLHADFLRVSDDVAIKVSVPLHFVNEETAPGVKLEGGIVQHAVTEIEIQCLPGNMPEYIEADLGSLSIGENIHLSDLSLPEGVESTALNLGDAQDLMVASIIAPRAVAAESAADDDASAADGDTPAEGGSDGED